MVKVRFRYSDGHFEVREFQTFRDGLKFVRESNQDIIEVLEITNWNKNETKRFMEL